MAESAKASLARATWNEPITKVLAAFRRGDQSYRKTAEFYAPSRAVKDKALEPTDVQIVSIRSPSAVARLRGQTG